KDSETGETLVYRTHSYRNSDTGETEIKKELLGGLYPFAREEDKYGLDYKDTVAYQKMAMDIGTYEELMANYERIDNLQKEIIDQQRQEIAALQYKVQDLVQRLQRYEK
ncbi:MAG: hypothetical protein LUD50_05095, partial [Clostridia bacterium]|nr:hypothetical protein [Clostridia bacterium]